MKCSGCGVDSNRKERFAAGGRCPRCQLAFVLDPQDGAPFTDVAFADAIRTVSADGRLRWGVEHLYYELCRRMLARQNRLGVVIVVGVIATLGGVGISTAAQNPIFAVLGLGVGPGVWLIRRLGRPETVRLDRREFDGIWARWQASGKATQGVIIRRTAPADPYRAVEPDLGDYSFDRAVICDRARTVDLLLANNFHFEHSCAVLSADGYPKHAFEQVRSMLQKNPKLEVFVLHDASAEGEALAKQLASDPAWFGRSGTQGARVVDVGLLARDAKKHRGLYTKRDSAPDPALFPAASAAEQLFLSQYVLELAALRPEKILKVAFRAMQPPPPEGTDGGSGDSGYWDSFG
jgi:hypothetical protein